MFKIATWNVNSIRSRLDAINNWLTQTQPDVICFQETKCLSQDFPYTFFRDKGYHLACLGQKSYNGVAIASKWPMHTLTFHPFGVHLPLEPEPFCFASDVQFTPTQDQTARYIEVIVTLPSGKKMIIASVYVPNGNPFPSEKYNKKLIWLKQLIAHAKTHIFSHQPFILAGDFNIIPQPEDAAFPENWTNDALFTPEVRACFSSLLNMGYTDTLQAFVDQKPLPFTFWDYKDRSFERNDGIRIDHILTNPAATDCLVAAGVNKDMRSHLTGKPSDHVPVWIHLEE